MNRVKSWRLNHFCQSLVSKLNLIFCHHSTAHDGEDCIEVLRTVDQFLRLTYSQNPQNVN